jgi:UDP-glucose 4-epimerase
MKDKVLVTGHRGFIGTHLCNHLNDVIKFDDSFELITTDGIDLCDANSVKKLPKVSFIIHLAAKTFIPESFVKPDEYYYNNVVSTLNILEKAKKDGANLIFLSTYIYGTPQYLPVDESHVLQPMNPYTQSKVICEQLCEAYSRDFSLNIIALRPFNIYGPGQSSNFFIPTILSQLSQSQIQLQDSKPKRDYIFINDLIDLIFLLMKQKFNGYEVYNVGTGTSYSVKDIVNKILNFRKSNAEVCYSDIPRQGEVIDCIASVAKLFNKYGWKPATTIDEGLQKVLEFNTSSINNIK